VEIRKEIIQQELELDAAARSAGVSAIIANGVTPGLSNLMGVHTARRLDEVMQLQCGKSWIINYPIGFELTPELWLHDREENLTALLDSRRIINHWFQTAEKEGSRKALDFEGGRWVEGDPVINGIDAPAENRGLKESYPYICCQYPSGLPLGISSLPSVDMRFSPLPPELHNLLRRNILRILEGEIDAEAATESFFDAVESDPVRWLKVSNSFFVPPELWVRAVGWKNNRAARSTCWVQFPRGQLSFLTAAALATTALIILRGETGNPGVKTAETAFELTSYIDEMATVMPDPPRNLNLFGESFEWMD
jgi:hypothetical protein